MTYALTLVKGKPGKREETRSFLQKLLSTDDFHRKQGVRIEKVFISFGWPDFVVLMSGNNVELIKHAIVVIREELEKNGDSVDTSTIICTTQESIEEKKREWVRSTTE
jgi:hypothetical protein